MRYSGQCWRNARVITRHRFIRLQRVPGHEARLLPSSSAQRTSPSFSSAEAIMRQARSSEFDVMAVASCGRVEVLVQALSSWFQKFLRRFNDACAVIGRESRTLLTILLCRRDLAVYRGWRKCFAEESGSPPRSRRNTRSVPNQGRSPAELLAGEPSRVWRILFRSCYRDLALELCERWLKGASAERKRTGRDALRHPAKNGLKSGLQLRKLAQ